MFEVRKSRSCGISAIFFQCCFMIETQVLMTVSDFSRFFSRNHFLEERFTFQWEVCFFRWRMGFIFKWGGGGAPCPMRGIGFDGGAGRFEKNRKMGEARPPCPPTMGNPNVSCTSLVCTRMSTVCTRM